MTKKEQLKSPPKKPRTRKCLCCREYFKPKAQGETTCSTTCAIEYGKSNFNKQVRRQKAKAKKDHYDNDKATLMKKAQALVNRYVRLRDKKKPCISCGAINYRQEAGHYRSAGGHGAVRFNTLNIWSQCHKCNCHMSANLVPYRENLIKRIGLDKVEWIESQNSPRKYTVEYLHRLIIVFRKKNKLMETRS